MIASGKGYEEIVEMLLIKEVKKDLQNKQLETALYIAL